MPAPIVPIVIAHSQPCDMEECQRPAESVVWDRDINKLRVLCDVHADAVVEHGSPEYRETCPNCGCRFGVN